VTGNRPRLWCGTLTRSVCSQRLEGSRFGVYLAALANLVSTSTRPKRVKTGGSRERLRTRFCPSRLFRAASHQNDRTATRRDVHGSRLMPNDRAAILQSGSPPGVGNKHFLSTRHPFRGRGRRRERASHAATRPPSSSPFAFHLSLFTDSTGCASGGTFATA
jgi:hypothetical protein